MPDNGRDDDAHDEVIEAPWVTADAALRPWLPQICARHQHYLRTLRAICASEGSLDEFCFENGLERFGLQRGLKTAINPDAHSVDGYDVVDYGVGIARKGWCTPDDVINAWPLDRLLEHLAARRRDALGRGGGR